MMKTPKTPKTKQEQRDALTEKQALIDEGKAWVEYIRYDLEKLVDLSQDTPEEVFFMTVGLLGNLADFDTDDVDYTEKQEEGGGEE